VAIPRNVVMLTPASTSPAVTALEDNDLVFRSAPSDAYQGQVIDRHGGGNISWNAAHNSRGCSQEDLAKTGGAGLFMCFATNGAD
ncbi:MAG: hypothetical protein AAF404_20425, partial [Pseudomonadota bacterium]